MIRTIIFAIILLVLEAGGFSATSIGPVAGAVAATGGQGIPTACGRAPEGSLQWSIVAQTPDFTLYRNLVGNGRICYVTVDKAGRVSKPHCKSEME